MKHWLSFLLTVITLTSLGCGSDAGNKGINSGKDMPRPADQESLESGPTPTSGTGTAR